VKIKVHKSTQRMYTDKVLEVYNEKGMSGVQEYCVCSMLNLPLMYAILLEQIEDKDMLKKMNDLIKFYNYEVVE